MFFCQPGRAASALEAGAIIIMNQPSLPRIEMPCELPVASPIILAMIVLLMPALTAIPVLLMLRMVLVLLVTLTMAPVPLSEHR